MCYRLKENPSSVVFILRVHKVIKYTLSSRISCLVEETESGIQMSADQMVVRYLMMRLFSTIQISDESFNSDPHYNSSLTVRVQSSFFFHIRKASRCATLTLITVTASPASPAPNRTTSIASSCRKAAA